MALDALDQRRAQLSFGVDRLVAMLKELIAKSELASEKQVSLPPTSPHLLAAPPSILEHSTI